MARKKRASLKDKGPEALGLTPKKGRGIDVLFGGPPGDKVTDPQSDQEALDTEAEAGKTGQSEEGEVTVTTSTAETESGDLNDVSELKPGEDGMAVAPKEDVSRSAEDSSVASPLPPAFAASGEVDELGLPVAMEAPPDDLEFAAPAEETGLPAAEEDAFDPSRSPFAVPPPPTAELDDDLSALLEEEGLAEPVAESEPAFTSTPPPAEDLSFDTGGEEPAADEPLPGVATTPAAEVPPPTDIPSTPPPPPAPDPFVSTDPTVTQPPPPQVAPPPSGTSTTPTSHPMPQVTVESLGGLVTERIETSEEDILPPDLRYRQDTSSVLDLKERTHIEGDEAAAQRVIRYIGQERRENLDREIERLYDSVATELSVNKDDVEFALRALSEAQDILFEDARQYDEALYRVAVVKTMLARKQNLRRWSYTWGMAVFFYALVWLAAFIGGFIFTGAFSATLDAMVETSQSFQAIRAAWFSALAGGVGGIIGIFYSLYWHVAMKQDFDRQYVMYYLVQPIMGFVLGAVIYFIVAAGFLVVSFAAFPENTTEGEVLASTTVIAIQIVFGFVAGFRQRAVFEMLDKIVKRMMPRGEDQPSQDPVSLVPDEQKMQIPPPPTN